MAVSAWAMDHLTAERGRWPLWLPIFLGAGIGLYFALPFEPAWWWGPLGLCLSGAGLWPARRFAPLWAVLMLSAMIALGFGAAQLRAAAVAAPVLERPNPATRLEGLVEEVEPLADGGQRVTLSEISAAIDGDLPQRVRLKLKSPAPISVGSRIAIRAVLMPPPQPAIPGGFDFARQAWFMGLGAIGTGYGDPEEISSATEKGGVGLALNRLRHWISVRILALLPTDGTGAVAAALITGETAAIPRDVLDAYRDSGLAHILSISGLHMGLAAGLVFFVVRGGLALIPVVALRWPIKKWAAAVALLTTFFYLLLAGAPVPAQRSFLMTAIVLVAVLLDRSALSMRLIAWAAGNVLILAPDALVGPSFQMSFAAVTALIAVYEVMAPRMAAWRVNHQGWAAWGAHYMAGVVLSTLVAGGATAFYGAYHFNRFAVWSVVSNALAVPLSGLTMPFAALGLILMPLGLDGPALTVMGWCVAAMNAVARWVAGWPVAAVNLPVIPLWGMIAFTVGGCWLVIWREKWRRWGLVPMVLGLSGMLLDDRPDIVVDGRGYAMAVRMTDGGLLMNRGGRILRESWMRRAGPASGQSWPKLGRSDDGSLSCEPQGCLYRNDNHKIALVRDDAGIEAACADADVVISAVPIRKGCRGPRMVVDRFDLWRGGTHAVWLTNDGARVESVARWQGDRPWSHKPKPRRRKPDPVPTEGEGEE